MTGKELNACFGEGFSNVKKLSVALMELSVPATGVTDHMADVQEQQHQISAEFDAGTGELKVRKDVHGAGLWIPWLGQGSQTSQGKGWGTYTKVVTDKTWVATGPFSGCYAVAFGQGGPRFAHIVTPGSGYTVASVDGQIAAITKATGAGSPNRIDMNGAGEGFVFFLKVDDQWLYRRVFRLPGGIVVQSSSMPARAF